MAVIVEIQSERENEEKKRRGERMRRRRENFRERKTAMNNKRVREIFLRVGRRRKEGGWIAKIFFQTSRELFSREGGSRSTPIEYFLKNSLSGKLLLRDREGEGRGEGSSDATIERTSLEDGINS